MIDNECDIHHIFGVVEDDEKEVTIEFDDEFYVDDSFYNKENLNKYFEEGFASNDATRWKHLKMENTDFFTEKWCK